MQPDLAIGLRGESEAPAAIAGLQRLIGDGGDGLAVENGGAFAVADAGGNFQAATERDVAVAFRGRAKQPGLYADLHISDAANAIDADGRIDLIAGALQDGHVGDDAPAAGELVVDADVKEKLVIFDLIVIDGALRLFVSANEVTEGIEFAESDVDGEPAQPLRIVIAARAAGDSVAVAEFVHDALIGAGSDATLSVSRLESAAQ